MVNKVLIIAEAGVNHNGNLDLAKKLVDEAISAGVDIIKFQTFKAENLVTKNANMADYQKSNTGENHSQFEMLKKLELNQENFIELSNYCKERNISFLSTGFDLDSLAFLETLNMGLWKVPSGEITNLPYLEFLGKFNQPVIVSTGMSNIQEIADAINVLVKSGTDIEKISILHCNTDYPTPFCDVNLNAISTIRNQFKLNVGYSDHTQGTEVSVAAVALGATIIEKHFTLDKNMSGPDHKASLDPTELKNLVMQIRNIESALGKYEKIATTSESKNIAIARKSIVAKKNIVKGEVFTKDNLTTKRPGSGISPMNWYNVLGTKASRDYQEDELI